MVKSQDSFTVDLLLFSIFATHLQPLLSGCFYDRSNFLYYSVFPTQARLRAMTTGYLSVGCPSMSPNLDQRKVGNGVYETWEYCLTDRA